jgi:type I restriction enzyme S subunit
MWDAHASGGAVFSNLSRAGLLSVQVPVPSLGEQSAIAEVLGALDERIEWCMSASTALIDLAETFWAQAAEINGLNTTVGDVTIFLNRRRVPLSAQERATRPGPYPYYGATGVFDSVDDFLFDGNYVLVGEDGSVVNGDGTPFVQYATGRFWVNNHAHVLESQTLEPEELYLALRRTIVAGYVTGAAQPKLSMGRLREVPLRIPASEAVARVREAIASMFSLYRELGAEADTLRRTRGALLPKLVSGELRIADPDALLEPIQ